MRVLRLFASAVLVASVAVVVVDAHPPVVGENDAEDALSAADFYAHDDAVGIAAGLFVCFLTVTYSPPSL